MGLTRTVTNIGMQQPLLADDGRVLANAMITFLLVDANLSQASTFDVPSKSLVISKRVVATTDVKGEFSVDLWPTSRGQDSVFYLVQIAGIYRFVAPLVEGGGPLAWADFLLGGKIVIDPDMGIHIQDGSRHLQAIEREALAAANQPSKANPFLTLLDLVNGGGGGGFIILDDQGVAVPMASSVQFMGMADGQPVPGLVQAVNDDGVIKIIFNFPGIVSGGQL